MTRRQRGASLITAVFLITALAGLGVFLTRLLVMQSRETLNEWFSAQALYAAESGVDYAAYTITTTAPIAAGTANIGVGSATATVSWTPTATGGPLLWTITSLGKAGIAEREIVVRFMAQP